MNRGLYSLINSMSKSRSTLYDNLYAVYKAESNANDSLGIYNGTAQGGLTYTTGKSGNAFTGNGTSGYVLLSNDALKITGNLTINIWVNIASSTTNSVFIQNYFYQGGVGEGGWLFEHRNNGSLRFYMCTSLSTVTQLNYSYSGNYSGWHMLTITKSSGTGALKLYIDGSLVSTDNAPGTLFYHTTNYSTIGASKYTGGISGYLENGGKIDEVGLWSKVLSSTEITELYNSGSGKFYPTF